MFENNNNNYNGFENEGAKKEEKSVIKSQVKTKLERLKETLEKLEEKRTAVLAKRKEEDKVYSEKVEKISSDIEAEEDRLILEAVKKAKKEGKDLSEFGL